MGETRDWLKFFEDSGIPRSAAAQYAVTFIENRISMNMLLDLNKEYLRDMGITKLGDIISILKHARAVSQRLSTAEALKPEPTMNSSSPAPTPTPPPPIPASSSSSSVPSTSDSSKDFSESFPLSARLGPPLTRNFSDVSKTVFDRLGSTKEEEEEKKPVQQSLPKPVKSAFDRLDSSQPMQKKSSSSNVVILKRPTLMTNSILSKSLEETDKLSTTHRLGNLRPVPAQGPSNVSTVKKSKKYVMIQTLKDGTKVKKILSPDDPILKRVPITKKAFKSTPEEKKFVNFRVTRDNPGSSKEEREQSEKTKAPVHQRIGKKVAHGEDNFSFQPVSRRKRISPPPDTPPKRSSFGVLRKMY